MTFKNLIILKSAGKAGALLFTLLLCHWAGAQHITVSLTAANGQPAKSDTAWWYLNQYYRGNYLVLDSVHAQNGKAVFTNSLHRPTYGRLIIPNLPAIDLLLSPQENEVTLAGNPNNFADGSYIVLNSAENQCMLTYKREEKEFNEFFSYAYTMLQKTPPANAAYHLFDSVVEMAVAKHNKRMREIADTYKGTFCAQSVIPNRIIPSRSENPSWLKHYAVNDSFLRSHYFHYLQLNDSVVLSLPSFFDLLKTYRNVYVKSNLELEKELINRLLLSSETNEVVKQYLFAWFLSDAVRRNNANLVTYLLSKFPNSIIQQSQEEQEFPKALRGILPGQKAHDVALPDTAGRFHKLAELAAQNISSLLFFYSHECEHCQATIPQIKAYCLRHALPFTSVLAINVHPDTQGWKSFVSVQQLPFTNLHLTDQTAAEVATAYAIIGIPMLLTVDNNFVITELFPNLLKQ